MCHCAVTSQKGFKQVPVVNVSGLSIGSKTCVIVR